MHNTHNTPDNSDYFCGRSAPYRELIGEILRHTNGASAAAMQERGLCYQKNHGVALPYIKECSLRFAPDYNLACELYGEDFREAKLAALVVAGPGNIDAGNMGFWMAGITTAELAEHAAAALFSRCGVIAELFSSYHASANMFSRYTALMAAAASLRRYADNASWCAGLDLAGMLSGSFVYDDRYTARAMAVLLAALRNRAILTDMQVNNLLRHGTDRGYVHADHIREELEWMTLS